MAKLAKLTVDVNVEGVKTLRKAIAVAERAIRDLEFAAANLQISLESETEKKESDNVRK